MKIPTNLQNRLMTVAISFILAYSCSSLAAVDDYTKLLTQARLFRGPLVWIGQTPPDEMESKALWEATGLDPSWPIKDRIGSLEDFIQTHPDSAWAAALNANLAVYYRSEGRYSRALDDWRVAWLATKKTADPNSQLVASFTAANWGHLLASLGRLQELSQLTAEANARHLTVAEFEPLLHKNQNALAVMKGNSGLSYRCGTWALFHVAAALNERGNFGTLTTLNSPDKGFSLAQLNELSEQYHLGLLAVKRSRGSELVVPSMVHWRENHYAAIVAKRNGLFNIIDPTFGRSQWLTPSAINEESDGYFMVPGKEVPEGWQTIDKAEAATVHGMGWNTDDPPPPPPSCPNSDPNCDCQDQTDDSSVTASSGCGCGMPDWQVTEPFISVWLHDKPMLYNMSIGRQFVFALDYHQRETRPVGTNSYGSINGWQVFNFGPNWNGNLLTYLDVQDTQNNPNYIYYNATQYCPDGGVRTYSWDGSNPDTRTYTQLERLTNGSGNLTGLEVLYPSGGQAVFGLLAPVSSVPPETLAMLTKVIDPQGHVMQYIYSTNNNLILLTNIIDFDGRTNRLIYANTNYPTAVTEVVNPYLATVNLKYDTNGVLTNLVDVMGISSSLQYVFTNEVYTNSNFYFTNSVWLLTSLQTPYGITSFNYFNATGPLFGNFITRSINVTQPDGGHQLYMYCDSCNTNPFNSSTPYLDDFSEGNTSGPGLVFNGYPEPVFYDYDPNLANFDSDAYDGPFWMYFRNSFFWGPRQYAALSTTNMANFTANDYASARMRNWLHGGEWWVSPTLNMEQEFSPDGTNFGESYWYGYPGKTSNPNGDGNGYFEGTNDLPDYKAWQINDFSYKGYDNARQPIGHYEYFQRNSLGKITLKVTTVETASNYFERTNRYIYATNNIDLLEEVGPDGVTNAIYGYDTNHMVLFMTNAVGEVTSYLYNTNEQVTSITMPDGLVTTNIYGTDNFLTQQIIIGYSTNSYAYSNGLVYSHTDSRGLTVTNTWDSLQRLSQVTYPDGTAVFYIYSNLDLVRLTDRMGYTISSCYDSMRRVVATTNADGAVTAYNYCTCGSLESILDADTNLTYFYYDSAGRRIETVYADGYTVTNVYNFYGQLLKIGDSSGSSINKYYDGFMNLTAVTNSVGQIAVYIYDVDNRLTNSTDANNLTVVLTYDKLSRLLTRSYPDGGTEGYGYSLNVSGPISYTNQIGNVWLYDYDGLSRKISETCVGVTTNQFAYNGAGDLLTLTDGKDQSTKWGYDSFGRVTNKLDAANNTNFIYQYNNDNRLINRWTPAKGSTVYYYDPVGNLTNVTYPVSPSISFSYDPDNRLIHMVDGTGRTAYGYDQVGQLLSVGGLSTADTVSYSYIDHLRTALSLSQPGGAPWVEEYGYDSARRLTAIGSPAGDFEYTYDAAKLQRVDVLELPNEAYITNSYDSMARLLSTALFNTGGTNLDSQDYMYNAAGQRTSETNTAGDYRNYTYDHEGDLIAAKGKEAGGSTRSQEQFGYAYDAAGNLNFRTNNALIQAYNVNNLNELTTSTNHGTLTVAGTTTVPATSVTVNGLSASRYADATFALAGFTVTNGINTYTAIGEDSLSDWSTNTVVVNLPATNNYTYDLNENLTSDGIRNFAYDDENELISVCISNAWSNSFAYDGKMRRRIERYYTWNSGWMETNEVHFIYDGNVVVEERNANNSPLVDYTRGNDLSGTLQGAGGIGGMLARMTYGQEIPGAPTTAFYHADGNGNITSLMYANQQLAAKYLYDPFGNALAMSGPLMNLNRYRFSSKEWNNNAGLYYYLYRFYDPNLQKWPNADPSGQIEFENVQQLKRYHPKDSRSILTDIQDRYPGAALKVSQVLPQIPNIDDNLIKRFQNQDFNLYKFCANNSIDNFDYLGLSSHDQNPGIGCYLLEICVGLQGSTYIQVPNGQEGQNCPCNTTPMVVQCDYAFCFDLPLTSGCQSDDTGLFQDITTVNTFCASRGTAWPSCPPWQVHIIHAIDQ